MAYDIGFSTWIPIDALSGLPGWATTWCQKSSRITSNTETPWLVECDPVLHPVTKLSKADSSIVTKIIPVKFYFSNEPCKPIYFRPSKVEYYATHTILRDRKPPYLSSKPWGESKWNSVAKGCMPAHGLERTQAMWGQPDSVLTVKRTCNGDSIRTVGNDFIDELVVMVYAFPIYSST